MIYLTSSQKFDIDETKTKACNFEVKPQDRLLFKQKKNWRQRLCSNVKANESNELICIFWSHFKNISFKRCLISVLTDLNVQLKLEMNCVKNLFRKKSLLNIITIRTIWWILIIYFLRIARELLILSERFDKTKWNFLNLPIFKCSFFLVCE